jgi:hypothetical protein
MEVSRQLHAAAALPRYPVMGPRESLDAVDKRKILPVPRIWTPAVQVVARRSASVKSGQHECSVVAIM